MTDASSALGQRLLASEPSQLAVGADYMWCEIPSRLDRISPRLGALARDGEWVRAAPVAAVVVPFVAVVVGALTVARQPSPIWAASLMPPLVFGVAGALGTGFSLWVCAGYLLGVPFVLLPLYHHSYAGGFSTHLLGYLGLLIATMVLFISAIINPPIVRACQGLFSPLLRRWPVALLIAENAVGVVLFAVVTWQWARSVPYLLRPFYLLQGSGAPDTRDIEPIENNLVYVWIVVAAAAAVRSIVVLLVESSTEPTRPSPSSRPRFGGIVAVPVQALVITLLGSGVLPNLTAGLLFFAMTAAALVARKFVLPRVGRLSRVVNAVPLLLRLGMIALVGYLVSKWLVGHAYNSNAQGLGSFAESAAVTLLISSLLSVAPEPAEWFPRRSKRVAEDWSSPAHMGGPGALELPSEPVSPSLGAARWARTHGVGVP